MSTEIKELIEGINKDFHAFKQENDARIEKIEKGQTGGEQDEKLDRIDDHMEKLGEQISKLQAVKNRPEGGGLQKNEVSDEEKAAFDDFLRTGEKSTLKQIQQKAGSTTSGGWGAGVPTDVSKTILARLEKESNVRDLITVENRGSTDVKDLVDLGGATVGWRGEGDGVDSTNTPQLATVTYSGGMIYALPKATEESFDDLFWDVQKWLIDSAVQGFVEEESSVILTGSGVNRPKGILTNTFSENDDSARTFGDLQFVKSGIAAKIANGTTSADAFINVETELHGRYMKNAQWGMHKKTLRTVRKLKDSDGNYIFTPAMTDGTAAKINGFGYTLLDDMPQEAAGALAVGFGDWKKAYKLIPIVGLRIMRDETTSKGNVLFFIRRRMLGGVHDSRALKFIKCAL